MIRPFALALVLVAMALPATAQLPEGVIIGIGNAPQGPPLNGPVHGLTVAADGVVWARGQFGQSGVYNSIARWDGTGWRGTASFDGPVTALALDASGTAYVGGTFSRIDDAPVLAVARWNGQAWDRLGTGVGAGSGGPSVNAVLPVADGSVVVAGEFTRAGSLAVANVARWTGAAWTSVGHGLGGAIVTLAEGPGGALYAGGFALDGPVAGEPVRGVMRWDGAAWTSIGDATRFGGQPGVVRQILPMPDGRVFARGDFDEIGGVAARGVAQWTGTAWVPLGEETYETGALVLGADGEVWTTGNRYDAADSFREGFLLRWTASEWTEVAGPISRDGDGTVLGAAPDGSFVVGGNFDPIGSAGAEFAVRWTGSGWEALGSHVNSYVSDIVPVSGGGAYVAGPFTTVPFGDASHIAEWTGSAWSALGDGLSSAPSGIALGPDGALYAGGSYYFPDADGNLSLTPAMRWDGEAWTPLTDPSQSLAAEKIVAWNGSIYIVAFDTVTSGRVIFRWTGVQWTPIGGPLDGLVYDLAVGPDGALYAGGTFRVSDISEPAVLARWTGSVWEAVRGVFDGWEQIETLASGADGSFYALGRVPGTSVLRGQLEPGGR